MLSQQAKEVNAAIHEEHGHRMILNNSAVPSQYLQSPAPIHAPPPPPPPSTNRKRSLKSGATAPTTSKRAVGTKQKKPRIPRVPTTSCSLVASRNVRHDLASTIDEIIASNEAILSVLHCHKMIGLSRIFSKLRIVQSTVEQANKLATVPVRNIYKFIEKPKPGEGKAYRRIVHYPKEYTVRPLEVTNLAGRDPVTGRVVANGIGGGIKHKYHWIKWVRDGPAEGPPQVEKVVEVMFDGCRTAKIALVAVGDELKYILATENMKAGDLIKTSRFIPRIPVRPNDGDAYPLGALPVGTHIHCLEKNPGQPCHLIHAAGTYGTIIRKFGDYVVVQIPSKMEFAFKQTCMATVGRVSNIDHHKIHIGSATRNRELGNRPRSGLWQRKDGRHGRKIRRLPPMRIITAPPQQKPAVLKLTDVTLTLHTK